AVARIVNARRRKLGIERDQSPAGNARRKGYAEHNGAATVRRPEPRARERPASRLEHGDQTEIVAPCRNRQLEHASAARETRPPNAHGPARSDSPAEPGKRRAGKVATPAVELRNRVRGDPQYGQ